MGLGFNSNSAGIGVDCAGERVSGEEVNAEFFSCSFNYFNYAPGFCTGLMHMSARYSRARIRFSIRISGCIGCLNRLANRWIGFCLSQISTLEGKIRFVLGVSDRVINYRFKNSRSVSFS